MRKCVRVVSKKTGAIYVYSMQSYRDKEKKAPGNRQACLGRLDEATARGDPLAP